MVGFGGDRIHNCLDSPELDTALSDDLSLLPHRHKGCGPTLHNVKAKRISLLAPNTKLKPSEDRKNADVIDQQRLKHRHDILKPNNEAVT